MKCSEIRPGMRFEAGGHTWSVIKQGLYTVVGGKRIPIYNRLRRKWYVRKDGGKEDALACFDDVIDESTYKFLPSG